MQPEPNKRCLAGLTLATVSAATCSKRGDIALALGIVCILVVLILPIAEAGCSTSRWRSPWPSRVIILMTVLFINRALDFSSFPTVLLIATMMRLALNLASTRLILADGHEGTDAAGTGDRGLRQLRHAAAAS